MGVVKRPSEPGYHLLETSHSVSFEALFDEFFDRLVYFSYQLTGDKDEARDIVQDAFIKYWDRRDTLVPCKTAAKNFLYSTVRNASLNSIRHKNVVENFNQLQDATEPEFPPVIEAIITAEVVSQIHSALQSLPANYRSVSVLSYFEGKRNNEIADDLAISVNTVKKQKRRALQLLRMKLAPEMLLLLLSFITKAMR
jgi:RNA polymerase sigma-70 factor (ECF subfamily)